MKLEIHKDNSAHYRWTLVADDGERLAASAEAFTSHATAVRAAENVRQQATGAPMEVG
jgi:uncharacterized protein YegP (UPF0339 family)